MGIEQNYERMEKLLGSIREQYGLMQANRDSLLDRDLLLEKIRDLYTYCVEQDFPASPEAAHSLAGVSQKTSATETTSVPRDKKSAAHQAPPMLTTLFGEEFTPPAKREEKKTTDDAAVNMTSSSVKDLKSAIGINEKFLFINELFDGSLQEYSRAIDFLNEASGFQEADNYMQNSLLLKYNWDKESPHVLKFLALVERKFH